MSDEPVPAPEEPPGPYPSGRRHAPAGPGSVVVFAADEQRAEPVDLERWSRLAEEVLRAEGVRGDTEVTLLFVDEPTIADLNGRFMGENRPTDVLSFPIDEETAEAGRWPDAGTPGPDRQAPDDADEIPRLLGDVLICPAVARRNAPAHTGDYDDELALLTVHGLLHLLGHDHADAEEEARMQAREADLLSRFHGPVAIRPQAHTDGQHPNDGRAAS